LFSTFNVPSFGSRRGHASHAADCRGKEDIMPSRPAPTRSLPDRLNLEQLRKQAKELLKAYRAGDATAAAEVERFESHANPANFALADAQRVLARAYGFASWTKLKQHVEGVNAAAFCAAVKDGDIATVRRLAKARPELVHVEAEGYTGLPLHLAVLQRDAAMAQVLMEFGADARLGIWPHRDATTAYAIASERGCDDVVAVIEKCEEARRRAASLPGATIDSQTDQINRAILQDRCDEAIKILESDLSLVGACNVEQPINGIDCRRLAEGTAPLHVAAWKHNPEMVGWLLERGAPVDARAARGQTPLDYAAMIAGWSAHGRDFSFLENSHLAPSRFYETVRLLRENGAELTSYAAVAIGDAEAVRRMHREGRLKNEDAGRGGLLSIAVKVNRIEMVSLLLDLGLDPNEPDEEDSQVAGAPLWFASMCGRYDIAELLISRGADVNAVLNGNADALYCAERTGDHQMQSLLLKRGARITVERVAGRKDRETARGILEGRIPGTSLNVEAPTLTDLAEQMLWAAGSCDPEIVRMCLPYMTRKPDDPWWNYVLMHATLPECFKMVLDHGVDPDVTGVGGHTTLHHLATTTVSDEHCIARAALLLDASASLHKRDELLKSTPLGWACRWGRAELVKLYLDRGADPVEADAEPWATPLAWATKAGRRDVIDLLHLPGAR
jgi:ankyrin repeat protein